MMLFMITCIRSVFSNSSCAMTAFALISAAALGIAFISQYVYGLQPCVLCIYQRIPYAVVIALGALSFVLQKQSGRQHSWLLGAAAFTFLLEMIIAAYHSGVERKWWPSFLEGCAVPKMEGDITDVLARIEASPVVRCDEIPWTDPILSLSMANYNVLFSLVKCNMALYSLKKSAASL